MLEATREHKGCLVHCNWNNCVLDRFRRDIQGLRGVSILSVLIFHLWSSGFPCGYLGVDVFFVISGYMMNKIMKSERKFGLKEVIDFYFRRLKRLIPLYLTVICLTLWSALWLLPPIEFRDLGADSRPTLYFLVESHSIAANHVFRFGGKIQILPTYLVAIS
ncbi:Acyl-transf-3 domain-containing protein [Aphelenchoides besseyi]|nr:Acyl-transf-3 domain-containing protein [Aphelenchoides besseyi]